MAPKFALQNVLDVRHSKVEMLEIELGKLNGQKVTLQERLAGLFAGQDALMEQLSGLLQGEMDLFSVACTRADLEDVKNSIAATREAIDALDLLIERTRQNLVSARQAEEALGILKKKLIEAHAIEQAQKEARLQDDLYIARAFRDQAQGA
jgi:flagellar export protein FliJ